MGALGSLWPLMSYSDAGGLVSPQDAMNAQRQGMLGLGAGLLSAAGPSRMPMSVGQGLAGGLLQGQQMQNSAIDDAMKRQLLASEIINKTRPQLQPGANTRFVLAGFTKSGAPIQLDRAGGPPLVATTGQPYVGDAAKNDPIVKWVIEKGPAGEMMGVDTMSLGQGGAGPVPVGATPTTPAPVRSIVSTPQALSETQSKAAAEKLGAKVGEQTPTPREAVDATELATIRIQQAESAQRNIANALDQISPLSAGPGSLSKFIPGSPAANLASNLKSLASQEVNTQIQNFKSAAESGGQGSGIGRIMQAEIDLWKDAYASIDQAQSPAQLRSALLRLSQVIQSTRQRIGEKYKLVYGQDLQPMTTLSTPAEAAAARQQAVSGSGTPSAGSNVVDWNSLPHGR